MFDVQRCFRRAQHQHPNLRHCSVTPGTSPFPTSSSSTSFTWQRAKSGLMERLSWRHRNTSVAVGSSSREHRLKRRPRAFNYSFPLLIIIFGNSETMEVSVLHRDGGKFSGSLRDSPHYNCFWADWWFPVCLVLWSNRRNLCIEDNWKVNTSVHF